MTDDVAVLGGPGVSSERHNSSDIQKYLRDDRNKIKFLNAVFCEGHPEMLVGAIWDVAMAMGLRTEIETR